MSENICPKCGTVNDENTKFCKECGARLGEEPRTKKILLICTKLILGIVLLGSIIYGCNYYSWVQKVKAPLKVEQFYGDIPVLVTAEYRSDKTVSVQIMIERKVEAWQIKSYGSDHYDLKLFCDWISGEDRIVFPNVKVKVGSNIYAYYSQKNVTLKEFDQIKYALRNSYSLTSPAQFSTDTRTLAEEKQAYYARLERQRQSERQLDALNAYGSMLMFGSMFGS